MKRLGQFCVCCIYCILSFVQLYGQENSGEKVIRIGLVADPQYANSESKGGRDFRGSLLGLKECLHEFNTVGVDMVICLGDMTDHNTNELDSVLNVFKQSAASVKYVLGNHDFHRIESVRPLMKRLGMKSPYYTVTSGEYRFVFLNTNDISTYTLPKSKDKEKQLEKMLARIKEEGRPNNKTWNGGIGTKQMKWLEKELRKAERRGMKVLLFAHHPIYPSMVANSLNDKEILETISKYSCVKAYINGHHHRGNYACYGNIPCFTQKGMVEYTRRNAFSVLSLYNDRIEIKGYGDSPSYVFP